MAKVYLPDEITAGLTSSRHGDGLASISRDEAVIRSSDQKSMFNLTRTKQSEKRPWPENSRFIEQTVVYRNNFPVRNTDFLGDTNTSPQN